MYEKLSFRKGIVYDSRLESEEARETCAPQWSTSTAKKKKKERKKKKMKKSQFEHRQMGYKSHILNYYASFYLCDIRIANKINLLCLQSSFAGLLS